MCRIPRSLLGSEASRSAGVLVLLDPMIYCVVAIQYLPRKLFAIDDDCLAFIGAENIRR
jgi:hypothetical protein